MTVHRLPLLAALLLGVVQPAHAQAPVPAVAASTSADAAFYALADAEWTWRQAQFGDDENDDRPSYRLPDVSAAAQAAREARWAQTLKALDAIDQGALSPAARVNYAIYRYQIETLLSAQRFHEWEKPLNSDTTFWGNLADTARTPFRNESEARAYITMLHAVPRYFAQQMANMKAGLARGFTAPQVTLKGRDLSLLPITDAKTADANPFFEPFKALPATIPPATAKALADEARTAITTEVVPAHRALFAYLRSDYLPHARTALAAQGLPQGKDYYQAQIREYTTTDLTPDAIHQIGLAEVARIRAQMQEIMAQVGFTGDLPAFLAKLRSDPQFVASSPQDLLNRAAWIAKTFDGKAADWFGRLPRKRFAIRPVPADIAPFYTAGRGGPGVYLVNTWNLPARQLYSLPALTLHESAPGHAFQMSLASENKGLPAWRQRTYISAYGEGWALYCEKLGVEMGIYTTPYERFGMLSYQMWRAARLVVDTGIHAKGWTREQALAFLHDNTALSDHEIETETDRYIAWPGQALSYYLGEMAIVEDRARAEKALGDKFNIRAFHDAVLELGSVPLPVLHARIDRFIAEGGKGPYPDEE
ncbi:DUF885 family protein [Novosphingobium sp. AAP1]|uniref:DUF885 domain-containing protein n=1 Tax=Novosphingobium sp. AAP1 TaxID=1523413 RepID=UPI000A7901C6|nr:DUF885 family protein [Novosphingobium sp. AAP1]